MNGCTFRLVDSAKTAAALSELLDRVWGGTQLVAPELVRAMAFSGGYAVLVQDGELVIGGSLGWIGLRDGCTVLHSHATGIVAAHRDRGIGLALKHHQREWAIRAGIAEIRWSFDPLVRRNAWFNLARIGAKVLAYERDFYGQMLDVTNRDGPSDRLIVGWSTAIEPVVGPVSAGPADVVIEIPDDIVRLRRDDPAAALAWRLALRDSLADRLETGHVLRGVDRAGSYVLSPR